MKTRRLFAVLVAALMAFPSEGADGVSTRSSDATGNEGGGCLLDAQELVRFESFTSGIPGDAYDSTSTEGKILQQAKKGACLADRLKVQRLYDIFSWQSFLAVNWPMSTDLGTSTAQLASRFIDKGVPQWTTWMTAQEVFKDDGSKPPPWNSKKTKPVRILSNIDQPFSYPLWDQNENPVYYEFLLNEDEYKFIVNNKLFNQEGQTEYLSTVGRVVFGPGSIPTEKRPANMGPVEIKLAWKILGDTDIPERFFKMTAQIPDKQGHPKTVDVGLVGMHIGHKTVSSPRWVWSTFEHVDNVSVNELEMLKYAKQGQNLRPSFYDSTCPTCPVNTPPPPSPTGRRTQLTRVIPISSSTADLNRQVQEMLREMGATEWQYYELVGTQYVTDADAEPTVAGKGTDSITNHSGGAPEPAYLANTVLESYFQKGNQESALVHPHGVARVFETSSCMSCHYDAGLLMIIKNNTAINAPGTADFSWLFSLAKSQTAVQPTVVNRFSASRN